MPSLFMDLNLALSRLHVSRRTLYRNYVSTGRLKPCVFAATGWHIGNNSPRQCVKFLVADIERLIKENHDAVGATWCNPFY